MGRNSPHTHCLKGKMTGEKEKKRVFPQGGQIFLITVDVKALVLFFWRDCGGSYMAGGVSVGDLWR